MSLAALAATALVISGIAVAYSMRRLKQIHKLENLPQRTIRSVAMGPVSIRGTIEPANTQLSPILAQPAVYGKLRIYTGKLSIGRPIHTQEFGTDFFVTDGTGTVRVDPKGAQLNAESEEMHTHADKLPEQVQEELGILARIRLLTNPWLTVTEQALKPHTQAHIRGIATDDPHMSEASETHKRKDVIIRARSNQQLIISEKDPSGTIQSYRNSMRDVMRTGLVVGAFSATMLVLSQLLALF